MNAVTTAAMGAGLADTMLLGSVMLPTVGWVLVYLASAQLRPLTLVALAVAAIYVAGALGTMRGRDPLDRVEAVASMISVAAMGAMLVR